MSAPLCTAYGAILIYEEPEQAAAFVKSLGRDKFFPFLDGNMFTPSEMYRAYKDDQMIVGFSATYSANILLGDIPTFILKFEHILRNIAFESATVHLEGSYYGRCYAAWVNKKYAPDFMQVDHREHDYRMMETSEWYFGYGMRELDGGALHFPEDDYDKLQLARFGYPVRFHPKAVELFNDRLALLRVENEGYTVSLGDELQKFAGDSFSEIADGLYTLLIGLSLQGSIELVEAHPTYTFRLLKNMERL